MVATYDQSSFTRTALCLVLVAVVIATDIADGWIARKYALQSKLGYLLDGLGDRAFHVACVLILTMNGILNLPLAWVLIFREVSQYAARILEQDWYSNRTKVDRVVTRSFAIVLQGLMLIDVVRALAGFSPPNALYVVGVNLLLLFVAAFSFSRITPRLTSAWRSAING
jgi:phosphatidylglycerophosphate synthase